jgi:hypothetical protein
MNKEFIPYEQALALKELGFDEPCLAYYNKGELFSFTQICNEPLKGHYIKSNRLCTPLYQQAFRWFREKYNMKICIQGFENNSYRHSYTFCVYNHLHQLQDYEFDTDILMTYEETELECLRKLIELLKPKQRI